MKKSIIFFQYTIIKFLYDIILSTIEIILLCLFFQYFNILNINYFLEINKIILSLLLFNIFIRIIINYDNRIPRILFLKDYFHGLIDSKKINNDYSQNKLIYKYKSLNIPYIKELNISMNNWLNKIFINFINEKEIYLNKVKEIDNKILEINKLININNEELEIINKKFINDNTATELYYLKTKKNDLINNITNLEYDKNDLLKDKKVLLLAYENKYTILIKEKNIICSDYEVRYKNYIKNALQIINKNKHNYKIDKLENTTLEYSNIEGV